MYQEEFGWKLDVGFDYAKNHYTLAIEGNPFKQHPYQAEIAPEGPQLIFPESIIKINEQEIKLTEN